MPTICTVSGIVLQPSGVGFTGVTVIATLDRPFIYPSTGQVIPNFVQTTTTAADGSWSLPLIETTTAGVTVTFAFQYSQAAGSANQRYEYTATIPNASSASFSDIINTTSDGEGFIAPAVPAYDTVADLPTTAENGFLARVLTSPASLYEYDLATTTWNLIGPTSLGGSGILSINADTSTAQLIVAGSSGTDFTIVTASGTTTLNLPTASVSNRGLLSSADWFTFNSKQNSILSQNLTAPGTDGIVVTGGTGAILSSASIAQAKASASQNGYLSSTDFTTFNNKQAPITAGNLTEATSAVLTITGGTGAVIGSGTTVQVKQASISQSGFLSSTDFTTFNSKGAGTVTAVSVASANGLAGTSSGGATPALTLSTSVTGIIKGNGTALSAATSGTDFSAGTSALATGIVKSTTSTGALTIAVAGDFPTLNQNTTGTAANITATSNSTLTTLSALSLPGTQVSGNISGNAANVTGTVAVLNGGTGVTTSTGSGSNVLSTSPTLVTPALGTPSAIVLTSATGLPLTSGVTGILPIANGGTGAVRPGLLNVVAKTTTYTALVSDDVITASGSAFTITLPAATNTGKVLRLKKTDASFTNIITIAAGGSDTIDGSATTTLNTQFETIELVADGVTTWNVIDRNYPQGYVSYTPTFVGLGTVANISVQYQRVGNAINIRGAFTAGSSTAVLASMTLPSGLTTATFTNGPYVAGYGWRAVNDASVYNGLLNSAVTTINFGDQSATNNWRTALNGNTFLATGDIYSFCYNIPIAGWN